jgi:DNA-binding NarL/FixJ family response regulator
VGFDPEAVAIARRDGDEDDYARTLESFDPRDLAATRQVIALGHRWTHPTASLRALTVAANDLQYRHGAFRDAVALWAELLTAAERVGAVSWQAQALQQRALLEVALGDFASARATEADALARYAQLGPDSGLTAFRSELAAAMAIPLDGDWATIAADLDQTVVRSPASANTGDNLVTGLAGLVYAGLAALAHARSGNGVRSRWLCDALADAIDQTNPLAVNQGHNGAIAFAVEALWILGDDIDLNTLKAYRAWTVDLITGNTGDYPQTSLALTLARASALLGMEREQREAFALAREALEASGQRPLRIIVDHDEALALLRGGHDLARAAELASTAHDAANTQGMAGWSSRAATILDKVNAADTGRQTYPAGLTEREVDVLRLVARGYSDRQISEELFISPRTVNAHVRNMLTKTDRANRTELSVWAIDAGIFRS